MYIWTFYREKWVREYTHSCALPLAGWFNRSRECILGEMHRGPIPSLAGWVRYAGGIEGSRLRIKRYQGETAPTTRDRCRRSEFRHHFVIIPPTQSAPTLTPNQPHKWLVCDSPFIPSFFVPPAAILNRPLSAFINLLLILPLLLLLQVVLVPETVKLCFTWLSWMFFNISLKGSSLNEYLESQWCPIF